PPRWNCAYWPRLRQVLSRPTNADNPADLATDAILLARARGNRNTTPNRLRTIHSQATTTAEDTPGSSVFNLTGLEVAFQAKSNDLMLAVLDADGCGFVTVLDGAWRNKCRLVGSPPQGPFGQCVVRLRPQIIFGKVTIPAAFRSGVAGEIG